MAKHDVRFQVPWRGLGKEDVVFQVVENEELLGTLKVSKGAVVWWPGKAKLGYKMTWERFDQVMRQGYRGRHS